MSGEFSGEDELDCRLDLSGGKGSSLIKADQLGALSGDSVEGVVDEGVDDIHGLFGNTDVGVHLFEHLVDVDRKGLYSSSPSFSIGSSGAFSFSSLGHFT